MRLPPAEKGASLGEPFKGAALPVAGYRHVQLNQTFVLLLLVADVVPNHGLISARRDRKYLRAQKVCPALLCFYSPYTRARGIALPRGPRATQPSRTDSSSASFACVFWVLAFVQPVAELTLCLFGDIHGGIGGAQKTVPSCSSFRKECNAHAG